MAGGDSVQEAIDQLKAMASGGGGAASTYKGPTAANSLGGSFVDGKSPMVYWGTYKYQAPKQVGGRSEGAQDAQVQIKSQSGQDRQMPIVDAVADWYSWTDAERSAFGQRMYRLGLVNDPNDLYGPGGAFARWQDAVQQASNFYTFANRKVTPWQVVDLMAGTGGASGKTSTSTSKNFNIPTVEDAHAATRGLFQSLMGRDPDAQELDRYASMITSYAKKHPQITKSTQTVNAAGTVQNSSSTSSGGWSEAGLKDALSQNAKADPEYGSYQAATTYFNAMIQALGGTGSG